MADSEPAWDLYRSFLEVLHTGSLSAAARSLRLTQPTVGRHIAALEQRLGGRALFTRHRSGLLPTEMAIQLRPYAESISAAAGALLRAASAQEAVISGAVRISASEVIGAEVLRHSSEISASGIPAWWWSCPCRIRAPTFCGGTR